MFTVGMFLTNCYVAVCEKTNEAIIIDPGFADRSEKEEILKLIDDSCLKLRLIVNTHGHPDHTCGNGIVKERFQAPIVIHENDAHMLGELGRKIAVSFGLKNLSPNADTLLRDGDTVTFGKLTLKVMHTPGHSPGSITLIGDDEIFTGDTLFEGSIGRTDFLGSSERDMIISLKKLASLPDYLVVYPGHGSKTTIGKEKRTNPFLQFQLS
jgi:glyoxylase-like metal-dependent hydrolase (beta-lactamase superfamily II)